MTLFAMQIIYDNVDHNGQMLIDLDSWEDVIDCEGKITYQSMYAHFQGPNSLRFTARPVTGFQGKSSPNDWPPVVFKLGHSNGNGYNFQIICSWFITADDDVMVVFSTIFDTTCIIVSIGSLVLCVRSIYRAQKLKLVSKQGPSAATTIPLWVCYP